MFRLAATGLLAAAAVAGLSACGSVQGSAHPVAAAATAAATSAPATATATPTPTPAPTAAPVIAPPRNASRPATGGGGSANAPSGGQNPSSGGGDTSGSSTDDGSSDSSESGGHASGSSAPSPKVTSLHVTSKPSCPVTGTPDAPYSTPGDQNVTIAWSVTGADGAALAVDQPGSYGAYGSDYPASGSMQFAFGCTPGGTATHTYTVWPAGAHGVSRTITVSAHSDG